VGSISVSHLLAVVNISSADCCNMKLLMNQLEWISAHSMSGCPSAHIASWSVLTTFVRVWTRRPLLPCDIQSVIGLLHATILTQAAIRSDLRTYNCLSSITDRPVNSLIQPVSRHGGGVSAIVWPQYSPARLSWSISSCHVLRDILRTQLRRTSRDTDRWTDITSSSRHIGDHARRYNHASSSSLSFCDWNVMKMSLCD